MMRGCGCSGLRGFGADTPTTTPAVDANGNVDPNAIAQLTYSDSYGRLFWKPSVEQLILKALPELWVAQEYSQVMPFNMTAPLARLTTEKPESAPPSYPTGTPPFTAQSWVDQAKAVGAAVSASYGLAIPSPALERMLIAAGGNSPDLVRAMSWMAPLLPSTVLASWPAPSASPPGASAAAGAGMWDSLGTVGKAAVVGGGLVVVAGAFGMLKRRGRR